MKKAKYALSMFLMLGFLFASNSSFGQIEVKSKKKKSDKDKVEKSTKELSTTELYFMGNWSSTNRSLESRTDLFGKPLGIREDETSLGVWSAGLGFRDRVGKFFTWSAGVSFLQYGEKYKFEDTDTLYSYERRLRNIAIPIKGFFTYGDKFRVYVGGGITPQMLFNSRTNLTTKNSLNQEETVKIIEREGYNRFGLALSANVGVHYQFHKRVGIYVMPEYRYQLTDVYGRQQAYTQKPWAIGFDFGLTVTL